MREPIRRIDVWNLPPIPWWRRHGRRLVGRIGAKVVEVFELPVMPPNTVHALAALWSDILMADLERRPPPVDPGGCAVA